MILNIVRFILNISCLWFTQTLNYDWSTKLANKIFSLILGVFESISATATIGAPEDGTDPNYFEVLYRTTVADFDFDDPSPWVVPPP